MKHLALPLVINVAKNVPEIVSSVRSAVNSYRQELALCLTAPRCCSWQGSSQREKGGSGNTPRWPGLSTGHTVAPPACFAFKVRWGRAVSCRRPGGEVRAAARAAGDWILGLGTHLRALGVSGCPPWRAPAADHAPHMLNGHRPGSGRAGRRGPGHGQLPAGRLCSRLDRR